MSAASRTPPRRRDRRPTCGSDDGVRGDASTHTRRDHPSRDDDDAKATRIDVDVREAPRGDASAEATRIGKVGNFAISGAKGGDGVLRQAAPAFATKPKPKPTPKSSVSSATSADDSADDFADDADAWWNRPSGEVRAALGFANRPPPSKKPRRTRTTTRARNDRARLQLQLRLRLWLRLRLRLRLWLWLRLRIRRRREGFERRPRRSC